MALYQVEGTSLTRRSLRVEAKRVSAASDSALQGAGCLSDLRHDHALRDAPHQVAGSRRLIETPAQDRIPHRPAARTGNESLLAAHSRGGPIESRAAELKDLIVIVIAVAAALLLDLFLFTWMAFH